MFRTVWRNLSTGPGGSDGNRDPCTTNHPRQKKHSMESITNLRMIDEIMDGRSSFVEPVSSHTMSEAEGRPYLQVPAFRHGRTCTPPHRGERI
jgi:hypothetical protein